MFYTEFNTETQETDLIFVHEDEISKHTLVSSSKLKNPITYEEFTKFLKWVNETIDENKKWPMLRNKQ